MPSYSVPHDFAEVHRQLEEAVAKLKRATDPDLRRKLLTEIRRLLKEADRLGGGSYRLSYMDHFQRRQVVSRVQPRTRAAGAVGFSPRNADFSLVRG
jgi:hypothetical protein